MKNNALPWHRSYGHHITLRGILDLFQLVNMLINKISMKVFLLFLLRFLSFDRVRPSNMLFKFNVTPGLFFFFLFFCKINWNSIKMKYEMLNFFAKIYIYIYQSFFNVQHRCLGNDTTCKKAKIQYLSH
jgi:hypothetical protein